MQDLEKRVFETIQYRKRNTARRFGIGLLSLLVLLSTAVSLLLPAFTLESVLSGEKKHDSKWEWKGEPSEDHSTVEPHEPPPTFPVTKKASVANVDPSDPANNTVTYTITVGDGTVDLSGYNCLCVCIWGSVCHAAES